MRFHTRLCLLITCFGFSFPDHWTASLQWPRGWQFGQQSARPDRENRAKEAGHGDTAAINHYSSRWLRWASGIDALLILILGKLLVLRIDREQHVMVETVSSIITMPVNLKVQVYALRQP